MLVLFALRTLCIKGGGGALFDLAVLLVQWAMFYAHPSFLCVGCRANDFTYSVRFISLGFKMMERTG